MPPRDGHHTFQRRDLLRETLMGPMAFVMAGVFAKDAFEMDFVHDENVVEAL
jgi:hypothetical protein